jgi:DNA adenine methylase
LIRDTPVTVAVWREQKEVQKEKKRCALLKLGFSTFFLNRTNRSGIINAGVIGGVEQTGTWKIDARFNKLDLIKRIERIAQYRTRIQLYNEDAVTLTRNLRQNLPANTLFFFDPPYYVKGQDLYLNYYNPSDHQEIADEVINVRDQKWIVTYDNVRPIRSLYSDFRQVKYKLNYSAAKANKGEEIMIFSDNLFIDKRPKVGNLA